MRPTKTIKICIITILSFFFITTPAISEENQGVNSQREVLRKPKKLKTSQIRAIDATVRAIENPGNYVIPISITLKNRSSLFDRLVKIVPDRTIAESADIFESYIDEKNKRHERKIEYIGLNQGDEMILNRDKMFYIGLKNVKRPLRHDDNFVIELRFARAEPVEALVLVVNPKKDEGK